VPDPDPNAEGDGGLDPDTQRQVEQEQRAGVATRSDTGDAGVGERFDGAGAVHRLDGAAETDAAAEDQ